MQPGAWFAYLLHVWSNFCSKIDIESLVWPKIVIYKFGNGSLVHKKADINNPWKPERQKRQKRQERQKIQKRQKRS